MILGNTVRDWTIRTNKLERLWLLAKIEFKLRYYENKLGLFWALLKPLMDMCIYYVAFKIILGSDVPAFASYLFIGLVVWNFFLESTSGTIQLLNTKKYLYEYSNMNKLEIYVSTLFANSIGFLFNLIIFLLFYNIFESGSSGFSFYNLWIIMLFINLFILSLGVSLILSTIYIVAKDISQIWMVVTSFLFFLSPIFYKLSTFETKLPGFEYGNPLAGIIINARRVMMEGHPPSYGLLAFDFCYALIILLAGLLLLNKLGAKAAEKIISMDSSIALRATNISKTFHISEDSHNTVKHRLFNLFSPNRHKEVLAIKTMNFEINRGECVGLIGRNGCGKSTLIRLLAGVYPVDTGTVEINGTTLIMNLGVGMSQELTARENIYVSSSVLGLKIKETDAIFDKIVDFAEIREFIDTKVKFFSSGMMARLGFSIAVNAGAGIMFLDEIFAVGDMKFQEKAVKVFESSWIEGKTVILVSHSMDVIRKYCNRTAYMRKGELVFFGETQKAIDLYIEDNQ